MSQDLRIERRGAALWLIIDRPEKRNALSEGVFAAIHEGLARSEADADVRAVVITGAGDKAFCSGADLDPDRSAFSQGLSDPHHPGGAAFRALLRHGKPVLARVNGACMAGGMGLLAAADLAIAARPAKFGLPEVKVGVFPMMVAALLIHRLAISDRHLTELSFLGEAVDSERALQMGLITRVVEPEALDEAVDETVALIASRSPTALRMGKYALDRMRGADFDTAMAFAESQIRLLGLSEDAREGVLAFSQKRPPQWTGR